MKKSGYRACYHIYLIFFFTMLTAVIAILLFLLMMITVQTSSGTTKLSNWPQLFTNNFKSQIAFTDSKPIVSQSGIELLRENNMGLQILDDAGNEIYAFQKPDSIGNYYSSTELLDLANRGYSGNEQITSIVGKISDQKDDYIYIIFIPIQIHKVTMYLNGENFTNGKSVLGIFIGMLCLVIIGAGWLYGLWTSKAIRYLITSVEQISSRNYIPVHKKGIFRDVYHSLNVLDDEIKSSDKGRIKTEAMRKEWIANITHDLKTPLSPIKGYSEMMQEGKIYNKSDWTHYAGIIYKNSIHMERLIDDLKLTYQLENGMLPVKLQKQDLIPLFREWVIDILNRPEYENRQIELDTTFEEIILLFDEKLLMRAFQNLLINAFVHGDETTEINIQIKKVDDKVQISITDNGKGMTAEETERLFERYYRGANTERKVEGTGLGMAIAKSIIEFHNGTINVSSIPDIGTTFVIELDAIKVN